VLEGLEGIAAGTGQKFDKQQMEQLIAGLDKRIFLMNNVHDDRPEVFETRWALSYLRGPLTRTQIKTLMDSFKKGAGAAAGAGLAATPAPATAPAPTAAAQTSKALLPPEITQYYIPVRSSGGGTLTYHPMLLGAGEVRYSNSVEVTQQLTLLAAITDGPVSLDWSQAVALDLPVEDLETDPQPEAQFAEVPANATKVKSYATWRKDLTSWIYRNQRLELLESPSLKIVSNSGESERDFRVRLQQLAREQRDGAVENLRQKYAPKFEQLEERKRRAEQAVAREMEQAKGQKMQTAISFGATLLGSLLGRKRASLSTLGRATTAVRGVGRSMKESQDVDRAEDNVAAVTQRVTDLEAEFQAETAALERSFDPQTEQLDKVSLKPTKANIAVKLVTLAWAPYWHNGGEVKPGWE
jgi:hypothetical protein